MNSDFTARAEAEAKRRSMVSFGSFREGAKWGYEEARREASLFDFEAHLIRQRDWSGRTFGPGGRAQGVADHIRKELREIEADPTDLSEWIDVVILALDGAWRSGAQPQQIIAALVAKQTKNEARVWPDWRTSDPNKAIEHDRSVPDVGLVDHLDPLEAL